MMPSAETPEQELVVTSDQGAREGIPIGATSDSFAIGTPSLQRLVSLDAFRGAIMLLMASSGFGIPQVAKHFPNSPIWRFLGREFDHSAWTGCSLWDLI